MAPVDYKTILLDRNRTELNIIAKKLRIKSYSHMTKDVLVESIVTTRTHRQIKKAVSPSFWSLYHNHIYGIASIVGLLLTVWALLPSKSQEGNSLDTNTHKTVTHENPLPQDAPTSNNSPNGEQVRSDASNTSEPSPTPAASKVGNVPTVTKPVSSRQDKASVYTRRARALYRQGEYQSALTQCNKALSIDPKNQEALSLRNSINATISILNR